MKRDLSYERFSGLDNAVQYRTAVAGGGPDQRRSARKPVSMEVTLGQCVTCFGKWLIRDLSLHGVFLAQASELVPVGTVVDVAFRCGSDRRAVMRFVSAQVVRLDAGGMALDFGRYGRGVHAELAALLRPV